MYLAHRSYKMTHTTWKADELAAQHGCVGKSPSRRPGRRLYHFGLLADGNDFVVHLRKLGASPYQLNRVVELRKSEDRRLPKPKRENLI